MAFILGLNGFLDAGGYQAREQAGGRCESYRFHSLTNPIIRQCSSCSCAIHQADHARRYRTDGRGCPGRAAAPYTAFGLVEMAESDYRHVLPPQHGGRQHPAMPRDRLAIVGHHAGHSPAELRHAAGDLRDLVGAMDLGIEGIGAQPVKRPSLDLARREDQVHGWFSSGAGRACRCAQATGPASVSGSATGEKTKAPARAILRALFFDDQWVGQGGQLCRIEK